MRDRLPLVGNEPTRPDVVTSYIDSLRWSPDGMLPHTDGEFQFTAWDYCALRPIRLWPFAITVDARGLGVLVPVVIDHARAGSRGWSSVDGVIIKPGDYYDCHQWPRFTSTLNQALVVRASAVSPYPCHVAMFLDARNGFDA